MSFKVGHIFHYTAMIFFRCAEFHNVADWKGGVRCPIPSLPKPRIRNSVSLPPCPNLSLSMSVQILCLFPTKCPSVLLPLRQNKGTYFYWMMLDSQGSRKDSWQTVKLSLYRLTESQVLTSPNLPDLNESWLMSHNLSHQYDTSQSYAKVKFDFVFLILDRYWAVDIFLSFCPLSNFWDKFMTHNIGSWGPGVTSSKESLPYHPAKMWNLLIWKFQVSGGRWRWYNTYCSNHTVQINAKMCLKVNQMFSC